MAVRFRFHSLSKCLSKEERVKEMFTDSLGKSTFEWQSDRFSFDETTNRKTNLDKRTQKCQRTIEKP